MFRNVFNEEVVGGAAGLMDVMDVNAVVDGVDGLIDGEQGAVVGDTGLINVAAASFVVNDGVIGRGLTDGQVATDDMWLSLDTQN